MTVGGRGAGGAGRAGLPISDIKVLDLTRLLPGGFCSLLLADLGAEVLKVEDTGMGDYIRWAPPYYEGADDTAKSALYLSLNRNKRSMRINLKEERGLRRVVGALVVGRRPADVVAHAGVLDLQHFGAEVSQQQRAEAAWEQAREV